MTELHWPAFLAGISVGVNIGMVLSMLWEWLRSARGKGDGKHW